jgi:hypothetical protein
MGTNFFYSSAAKYLTFSTWLRQYLQYFSSAGVNGLLYLPVSMAKE